MFNFTKYSSKFLQLLLIVSLVLLTNACSGGSSSNGGGDDGDDTSTVTPQTNTSTECSDGFGDASRCDARENL